MRYWPTLALFFLTMVSFKAWPLPRDLDAPSLELREKSLMDQKSDLIMIDNQNEEDGFVSLDGTFDAIPDAENNIVPPQHLGEGLAKGQSESVKGGLSCKDVLSGAVSMTPDLDASLICQNCYTFCMMELVILEYLHNISRARKKPEEQLSKTVPQEIARGKRHLAEIRRLLPGFLDSCAAAFWAFKTGGLRNMLNEMQLEFQRQNNAVSPYD